MVQVSFPSAAVTAVVPAVGDAALADPGPVVADEGADGLVVADGAVFADVGCPDGSGLVESEQPARAARAATEARSDPADLTNMRDWKGIRAL